MKTKLQSAKLLIVLTFSFTVVFSACQKDKDDEPQTKKELLTSSKWKITGCTVSPEMPIYDENFNIIGSSAEMFDKMEACIKDDTFKYNMDLSVIFDEGASKCEESDSQTISATWDFKANETILSHNSDGYVTDYNILELTDNILRLQYPDSYDSQTYTITLTFNH